MKIGKKLWCLFLIAAFTVSIPMALCADVDDGDDDDDTTQPVTAVPDAGSTIALLGWALWGVEYARRKLKK